MFNVFNLENNLLLSCLNEFICTNFFKGVWFNNIILYSSGVLRLNKKSLAQSSEKQKYCYLIPKQTYLNVDEDAALTLERKRNHMYCLIVQIMKNEKEMHIDNLVFKVTSDSDYWDPQSQN